MSETPTFLRRKQPQAVALSQPDQGVDVHPEVKAFLSKMRGDADRIHQMSMQLEEARCLIDKLEGRSSWASTELARTTRQRDVSQKGFAEQKIHFAVALSSALAAKEHALVTIDAAYRQARQTNESAYEQAKATNEAVYQQGMEAVKAAYEPFVEAAHAAMRAIHEEMREAGMDPMDGERAKTEHSISNEDMARIGARFGANNRPPELPADEVGGR